MMGLGIEEVLFAMQIINLNAKMCSKKIMVVLVFEIDSGSIYIIIT